MSAHPSLSEEDVQLMVEYILGLNETDKQKTESSELVAGSFTPEEQKEDNAEGVYLFHASYTDEGNNNLPSISSHVELVLRESIVSSKSADTAKGFMKVPLANSDDTLYYFYGSDAYLGYQNVDLTGISSMHVRGSPILGGNLEIRIGSPNGELLGSARELDSKEPGSDSLIHIDIKPTIGIKDLYLVARNDTAQYHQTLFSYESLEFHYSE